MYQAYSCKQRFQPVIEYTERVGYAGRRTSSPVSLHTHPGSLKELSKLLPQNASSKNITSYVLAPIMCGCISFWLVDPAVEELLLKPLLCCPLKDACILPHGATGYKGSRTRQCKPSLKGTCHRGDQSVLSVILYGYYTGSFVNKSTPINSNDFIFPYEMTDLPGFVQTKRQDHAEKGKEPQLCWNITGRNSTYDVTPSTNVLLVWTSATEMLQRGSIHLVSQMLLQRWVQLHIFCLSLECIDFLGPVAEQEPSLHLHKLSRNGTVYENIDHPYYVSANMSGVSSEYLDLALKASIMYMYGDLMLDWGF